MKSFIVININSQARRVESSFVVCVLRATLLIFIALCCGCASARKPVPPGTVPEPPALRAADERNGQETLGELSRQYQLSRDDAQKDRVEQLVARLAAAALASNETPWHITVFNAPTVKNAAATRGNFLFVWSGLLDYLRSDEELAVILAHELGHILAGHTMPDPAQTANQAMAQVGGAVAGGVIGSTANFGLAGDLAGKLTELALQALIVNPGQRRVETEADEIGLFLLAKAGFDPDNAINFWQRVQNDPNFGGGSFAFLSTHPSSSDRFTHLLSLASAAQSARLDAYKIRSNNPVLYELPSRRSAIINDTVRKNDFFFGAPPQKGWVCGPSGCIEQSNLGGKL